MHAALIVPFAGCVLLGGCAYHLGSPEVAFGDPRPVPLVHPSTDGDRWYVPVETAADGPRVFFVDTGYSFTTCDDTFVEALGVRTRGRSRVRGELGALKVTKARLPSMTIGGHTVDGLVCQVRDLNTTSSIRDPREVGVAGVIGTDLLQRFHATFDPASRVLELRDASTVPALEDDDLGVVRLRREPFGIRWTIPLDVADRRARPVLDTGAAETYLDAAQLGFRPDWEQEDVLVRGSGGSGEELRTLSYYELELGLGGHPVGRITVTGRPKGPLTPGLVGLDVLGAFRAELDFPRKRARFAPVTPAPPTSWYRWTKDGLPDGEPLRL